MVADIAAGPVSPARETMSARNRAFLEARDALDALRQPRQTTEAERKLDEVLQNLKTRKSDAAREAARRKIEQIKAKLNALKLAAGSAAATGDGRLARKVARDIRDAARELGKALNEAGGSGGIAATPAGLSAAPTDPAAQEQPEASAGAHMKARAEGNDLNSLKSDATGLLRELKKIMRKLRETAFHPCLERKDRAEMEKMLTEAERDLAGLQAAALPTAGGAVDLSA